jgi:glycosyltransferase involved in cell wall biosynthesis
MRKVLIVAPYPPHRGGFHGGTQVIGRLIEELAETHSLGIVYFKSRTESSMEAGLAERCDWVEEVPRRAGGIGRACRLLRALARGYPMWAEDWRVNSFHQRLQQLIDAWRPEIVHFETHTLAQYADAVPQSAARIMVEHEAGAAAARDRWHWSRGWRKYVLKRQMLSWTKYEREHLQKFDAVVCFTELDRRELLTLRPGTRVEVIAPRGPAVPHQSAKPTTANTILFIGNFIHPPNVDAAMRLAQSIFPLVKARHKTAVLQLVGDSPPARLRTFVSPDITIPGRVPEVASWLHQAAVVVIPLRMGGGIRIKMMDALAAGKAIVGTPLAAEGIAIANGREMLLAETDQAFADAICALLSDSDERERLSKNARAFAMRFAAPGRVSAAFEDLYNSLVRERSV